MLDGWPKTFEQASLLFTTDGKVDQALLPNSCFFVESTEEEVKERLKKLPAEETQGTHWNEEATNRRLTTHKKNLEGTHIRKFFEDSGVDVKSLPFTWSDSKELIQFVERVQ